MSSLRPGVARDELRQETGPTTPDGDHCRQGTGEKKTIKMDGAVPPVEGPHGAGVEHCHSGLSSAQERSEINKPVKPQERDFLALYF